MYSERRSVSVVCTIKGSRRGGMLNEILTGVMAVAMGLPNPLHSKNKVLTERQNTKMLKEGK